MLALHVHESFCLVECVSDWPVRTVPRSEVMKSRTCTVRRWHTLMHGLCSSAVDFYHLTIRSCFVDE